MTQVIQVRMKVNLYFSIIFNWILQCDCGKYKITNIYYNR